MRLASTPTPTRRTRTVAVSACAAAPVTLAGLSQAVPSVAADPAVATRVEMNAVRTIYAETLHPFPPGHTSASSPWPCMTQSWRLKATTSHTRCSRTHKRMHPPEVAAATAAYRVLSYYIPASAENLAADCAAPPAGLPHDVGINRVASPAH